MLILIHLAGWGFRVAWLCGSIFFWPKLHTVILLFCLLHRVPLLGFSSWAQRNHSTQRLLTERDMLGINGGVAVLWLCHLVLSHSLWPHGLHIAGQAPLSMGSLQAGIMECAAMPSSRGSSKAKDQTGLPHCLQILYSLSHQGSPNLGENHN